MNEKFLSAAQFFLQVSMQICRFPTIKGGPGKIEPGGRFAATLIGSLGGKLEPEFSGSLFPSSSGLNLPISGRGARKLGLERKFPRHAYRQFRVKT